MRIAAFLKARLEHLRNERRSRAEIEQLQVTKFRRLVTHAYQHSPYYREIISKYGIDLEGCRPSDFPTLTKSDLMENFDRIVTDRRVTLVAVERFIDSSDNPTNLLMGEYVVLRTSGTTGIAGCSIFSSSDWARGTALGMRVWPLSLRRRRMAFFGMLGGHFGGAAHAAMSKKGIARLRFTSSAFDVRDPIEETIERLNIFAPETLAGYPSSLIRLAESQLGGDLRISPRSIACGGEPISTADREMINQAFGATILNVYGTTEHLTMGVGRPVDGGIYLYDDEFIFEIESDQVLITNLYKYAQPMIRYAMDDVLVPLDDPEPALPFTKIEDIAGRADSEVTFTDQDGSDAVMRTSEMANLLVPVRNVSRIELCVIDAQTCVLRARLKKGINADERRAALQDEQRVLDSIFEPRNLGNVARTVEEVESFGHGKAKLIVTPSSSQSQSS